MDNPLPVYHRDVRLRHAHGTQQAQTSGARSATP